ncbi:DUF192 domain-containing protein [Candidatus Saccharibacteria bacterium]|nr:DUF192 domain-containing protein [Candidatus Saccharibacteria bacterium]
MVRHRLVNNGESQGSIVIFIVFGVLVAVGAAFYFVLAPYIFKPTVDLWLGDGIFRAQIATDGVTRQRGLSGVDKLDKDQAMLFVFPVEGRHEIWMKDMKIPIDIVWLNKDRRVIFMVKNAQPTSSKSGKYKPETPALYVVEFPAGTVDSRSIIIDGKATFKIDMESVK